MYKNGTRKKDRVSTPKEVDMDGYLKICRSKKKHSDSARRKKIDRHPPILHVSYRSRYHAPPFIFLYR